MKFFLSVIWVALWALAVMPAGVFADEPTGVPVAASVQDSVAAPAPDSVAASDSAVAPDSVVATDTTALAQDSVAVPDSVVTPDTTAQVRDTATVADTAATASADTSAKMKLWKSDPYDPSKFVDCRTLNKTAANATENEYYHCLQNFVVFDMPEPDRDPETTIRSNIGMVSDSLEPLENYVSWAGSSSSSVVLDYVNSSSSAMSSSEQVASSSSSKASKKIPVEPGRKSIPLPRQTSYTGVGLSVGLGAGIYDPMDECDCMGVWQAQVEYFYKDWISGGVDVRFLGGDLDDISMLMYQRYRLDARFHMAWSSFDMFLEPFMGFKTTSISEFRKQVKNAYEGDDEDEISDEELDEDSDSLSIDVCRKMFSLDGFSLGAGAGFGWRFSRFIGLTGNAAVEYNFSKSALLTLTPGLAMNAREFWPWARKNLRSVWISAEFGAQRFINRGVKDWTYHAIVGFQVGI